MLSKMESGFRFWGQMNAERIPVTGGLIIGQSGQQRSQETQIGYCNNLGKKLGC